MRSPLCAAGALLLGVAAAAAADQTPVLRCGTGTAVPADAPAVPDGWCGTGTGGLHVLVDGKLRELQFPLEHTDVDAEISGSVARVRVTQIFTNPYLDTIEATYVFPLPHRAAVDGLEMRLGDRVIHGVIERQDEARRIYENARASGHVAALLEQERPNIFTQSVANILPGNRIEIEITYVETLDYDRGEYAFEFPMVVGPRFLPPGGGRAVVPAGFDSHRPVPPPSGSQRINPPFLAPGTRSGHDIAVRVRLDAGGPVRDLRSPTHAIRTADRRHGATVELNPLDTIPNKDLVLRWRVAGNEPEASVLAAHDGETGYLSVSLYPELDPGESRITPKEMIFVLDCSGSMSGEPMAAAKGLVRHALANLRPGDSFQILRFSTDASGFAAVPQRATPGNVARGVAYIETLHGSGGTMMIEGIRAALDTPDDPERLRIVMFLTDGYIGNENEILAAVRDRVRNARLFSFGVGSSVNRFLLDRMAEEGRGEVQYFLPGSSVPEEVSRFYDRIRSPYLTDIELSWRGVEVSEMTPARVPDVFAGRPLEVRARYRNPRHPELRIRGRIAGRTWEKTLKLDLPARESGNPAIGTIWARARIADLERSQVQGAEPRTVERITELALRHRLVTAYTSFVAVEDRMVVSNGRPTRVRVPVEMPQGVSHEGVFGRVDTLEESAGIAAAPNAFKSTVKGTARAMIRGGADVRVAEPGTRENLRALGSVDGPARNERVAPERDRADADPAPAMTGTQVRWSVERTDVALGDRVVLILEITNHSRYPVSLPESWLGGPGLPTLRVIDGAWNERTVVDRPAPGAALRTLAAGETVRRRVEIDTRDARFFAGEGTYHLILPAGTLSSADSNRVTVRITAPVARR